MKKIMLVKETLMLSIVIASILFTVDFYLPFTPFLYCQIFITSCHNVAFFLTRLRKNLYYFSICIL